MAVHRTQEHFYEAELYRIKGELLLQCGIPDRQREVGRQQTSSIPRCEAEPCFHRAIEIAQKQNAKYMELRAVMSLSRLWQQQGKRVDAREMLVRVYGWFTEGVDTANLKEARALLEELA